MIKISKKKENRDFTNITHSMSGEEIAAVLGIKRQAVSNTLKRAMGKTYYGMKKLNNSKPFETMVHISLGFEVPEIEMKNFYRLFPIEIRKEIKEDAKEFRT